MRITITIEDGRGMAVGEQNTLTLDSDAGDNDPAMMADLVGRLLARALGLIWLGGEAPRRVEAVAQTLCHMGTGIDRRNAAEDSADPLILAGIERGEQIARDDSSTGPAES